MAKKYKSNNFFKNVKKESNHFHHPKVLFMRFVNPSPVPSSRSVPRKPRALCCCRLFKLLGFYTHGLILYAFFFIWLLSLTTILRFNCVFYMQPLLSIAKGSLSLHSQVSFNFETCLSYQFPRTILKLTTNCVALNNRKFSLSSPGG